ncbi:Putative ribonuclease H protein At1g65750, partial [Linum perenne]
FLWASELQKNKLHWIAWEVVKAPRSKGGLGFQDLKSLNTALLGKWAWRFAVERNAWWRSLMIAKCGGGKSEWQACWNEGAAGCSMWRWIILFSSFFWQHGFLDPGGGWCDFWFDFWVRGVRLCDSFPRIAAAAINSVSSVYEVCFSDTGRCWNISLFTSLRGGALLEWQQLLELLEALPANYISAGPAAVVWPLERSGTFSISSMRNVLVARRYPLLVDFPREVIWEKAAPPKIQTFLWMNWHRRIATIDNLQRRGMVLVNWCVLCTKEKESIDHIFIHCPLAVSIWNRISSNTFLVWLAQRACEGFDRSLERNELFYDVFGCKKGFASWNFLVHLVGEELSYLF